MSKTELDQIIQAIRESGLSQREIAAKAGVSHPTILRLVNGQNMPSYDKMVKIAAVVGLEITIRKVD